MTHFKKLITLVIILFSQSALANLPYYPIVFPRDDAAHNGNTPYPVTNMTEWWYYNGKFTTMDGRNFGYCVFYLYVQQIKNGQKILYPMVYFLLTDIDKQKVYKFLTHDLSITELDVNNLNVAFGNDFKLRLDQNNIYSLDFHAKTEDGTDVKLSLDLTPAANYPVMLNGKTGLIDMWDNTNSYYYSRTHLNTVSGSVNINNDYYTVNPAKSLSWMDHQWGDFMLNPLTHPWVWASIQLDNGMEMNVIGKYHPLLHQTYNLVSNILLPNGAQYFYTTEVQYTPAKINKGQHYPASYTLNIKPLNLSLKLYSLAPDQYVGNVWEGVSSAVGTFQGQPVAGQSYTENTSVFH